MSGPIYCERRGESEQIGARRGMIPSEGRIPADLKSRLAFAYEGYKFIDLVQDSVRVHQVEMIRVRAHNDVAFREFSTEDWTVKIFKLQAGKSASGAGRLRKDQAQRRQAAASGIVPSSEDFKARAFTEWTDYVGGGTLKDADVAMEFTENSD